MSSQIVLAFEYVCKSGKSVVRIEIAPYGADGCTLKTYNNGKMSIIASAKRTADLCTNKADDLVRKYEKVLGYRCEYIEDGYFEDSKQQPTGGQKNKQDPDPQSK
jgi:hypothetical protein